MERKTLARWLVVSALACFGSFLVMGSAQAQDETTIQGTQSSTGAAAATGNSTGNNSSAFDGGPAATGATGASSSQLGTNSGSLSQDGTAETGDPVAGSQVTGAVADNVTVQNTNTADDAFAESGDADVTNDAEVDLGPSAETATGPATASQIGNNVFDLSQTAGAATGDAVAGGQVTGIVGGGEHVVQNQNTATDGVALTGDAFLLNTADLDLGPFAETDDTASTSQIGDNDAVITQSAAGDTGDAVAQSQVTGIVGGSATVQNQNSSEFGTAESGDVEAENEVFAVLGPTSTSFFGTASSAQTGDNSVDLAQQVEGNTGDALAGAQVTGAVGDQAGFLTVQNQQASEDDFAQSGDSNFQNFADIDAAPTAFADTDAQASQIGDNDVTTDQIADGTTGDALAGAQVTGAVGHQVVTVQNSNTASFATAITGEVDDLDDENNRLQVDVGPLAFGTDSASASQVGDNAVFASQAVNAETGDAVAGGQVTGVVATANADVTVQNTNFSEFAFAESGEVDDAQNEIVIGSVGPTAGAGGPASSSQNGDNALVVGQDAQAATGDAVAGGQVTGVVAGSGSEVTVQNANTSEESVALSGDVDDVENDVFATFVGPSAASADVSSASQVGDNTVLADQVNAGHTGDAVAGSQVTGVVTGAGSEVEVQNTNFSSFDFAETGEIDDADNEAFFDFVGPRAIDNDSASASQIGDNDVALGQAMDVSTGDAVAGSQVTGVVAGAGSEVTQQNSNTAEFAAAITGQVDDADNTAFTNLGPNVLAFGDATVSQVGDNTATVDQLLGAHTGDAVAGSQVSGIVAGAGSEVTTQNTNTSEFSFAETGEIDDADNELDANVGPVALSDDFGDAAASQVGDNALIAGQDLDVSTGDAVAGAQVSGVVTGAGSTIEVQNTNTSSFDTAITGDVEDAFNEIDANVGPEAESFDADASASQVGDNTADTSQTLTAETGDAVAGSQVTGVVGGGGSSVTVQNSNTAEFAFAESGELDFVENDLDIAVGPRADADDDASASQIGDSSLAFVQDIAGSTGDAVAGSQVTGVVGASEAEVQLANADDSSFAVSGDAPVANLAAGTLGPAADAALGTASTSHSGDTGLLGGQLVSSETGDAVAGAQVSGAVE